MESVHQDSLGSPCEAPPGPTSEAPRATPQPLHITPGGPRSSGRGRSSRSTFSRGPARPRRLWRTMRRRSWPSHAIASAALVDVAAPDPAEPAAAAPQAGGGSADAPSTQDDADLELLRVELIRRASVKGMLINPGGRSCAKGAFAACAMQRRTSAGLQTAAHAMNGTSRPTRRVHTRSRASKEDRRAPPDRVRTPPAAFATGRGGLSAIECCQNSRVWHERPSSREFVFDELHRVRIGDGGWAPRPRDRLARNSSQATEGLLSPQQAVENLKRRMIR